MDPERRPLLLDAEMQGRSARARLDTHYSPDATLVDADDGKSGVPFRVNFNLCAYFLN